MKLFNPIKRAFYRFKLKQINKRIIDRDEELGIHNFLKSIGEESPINAYELAIKQVDDIRLHHDLKKQMEKLG